ncbi:YpmS family protein [Lactococcus termiticola]|uniref:Membrane protein n=1 Tax=Lactococcus termiticola TaxID=2169526 RepID=A0A2R5HIB7_9LACT|nr:YpmS family protein [Lactococcus termiticola]GBG97265.1 membrane protein [Lactococcus termiticola]
MRQMKEQKKSQKKSIWKWLFFLLLAINLAGMAFVAVRVLMPRDQATLSQVSAPKDAVKVGQLDLNRDQINQLVNGYLESYQSKEMSYKFYLSNNQAVLEASYQLFGTSVPFYVYFQPLALENGSVALSVTSVSAGSLSLPANTVLSYIKGSLKLPDFVQIDSKNDQIIIELAKASSHNISISANKIDLANDQFSFDLIKK